MMSDPIITVSPEGSDTADGIKLPVRTPARALEAARETGAKHIRLERGEYILDKPLRLDVRDSGLTIDGGGALLTPAKPLRELSWERWERDGRVLRAKVDVNGRIDMLYSRGVPLTLARYPNYEEGKLPLGGAAGAAELRERSARWAHPETGYIRALHQNGWGGNSYFIRGRLGGYAGTAGAGTAGAGTEHDAEYDIESEQLGLSLRWIGDNNRGRGFSANALVAEGILEELDAPGEWFHDDKSGCLYVYPPEGDDLSELYAASDWRVIDIRGDSAESPARDITIRALRIAYTARSMFSGENYLPLLRGDWRVQTTGAVRLENTLRCAIEDCDFCEIGGTAVFMYGKNALDAVRGCSMWSLGASGIQVAGKHSAVRQPSYWENALGLPVHATSVDEPDLSGPADDNYPRDIEISRCRIEEIGIFEKQSSGVNISAAARVRIRECTIYGSARSCVNINDGCFGGHELCYCDIGGAQRETTDHGPFNSWGRDRFWSVPRFNASGENGGVIRNYNSRDIAMLDCVEMTRIHHNRFTHDPSRGHSWGIDLDDGSSNYDIYDNIVIGTGIKLREGFGRRVRNNVVVGGSIEIHVPYEGARDRIWCNVICSERPWGFAAVDEARLRATDDYIDRNVYVGCAVPELLTRCGCERASLKLDGGDDVRGALMRGDFAAAEGLCGTGFVPFALDSCGCGGGIAEPRAAAVGASVDGDETLEWLGATVSRVDDSAMSAAAVGDKSGLLLRDVPEESEAYRLGLRRFDIVTERGGTPLAFGSPVPASGAFRVRRGGAWMTI